MKVINFVKMHGLGNDFVIINSDQFNLISDKQKFIQSISDRRIGIGCDQFIVYDLELPNFCKMFIYNSDGKFAEACGNGTRCVANLIFETYGIKELNIKTKNRVIYSFINDLNVSVNMGKAYFKADWMPEKKDLLDIANLFEINIKDIECVDVGNPHLVIFGNNISDYDRRILIDKIETSELFNDGVNISFARIENNDINLYVWERGVGHTLACGSAACASFAAAYRLGFVENDTKIKFRLGSLKLHYEKDEIIMTGPASKVISGDYYYEQE